MAFSLYGLDLLIKPVFASSEGMAIFLFLIKGAGAYFVYRWFQCDSAGNYKRHALQNVTFWQLFTAGVVGGVTLMIAGNLVGEKNASDFMQILIRYGIEAVILNFVYGATGNMIASHSSSSGSSSSGTGLGG